MNKGDSDVNEQEGTDWKDVRALHSRDLVTPWRLKERMKLKFSPCFLARSGG